MCEDVGGSSVGIRLLLTADTQVTIDAADDMVFVEHLETLAAPDAPSTGPYRGCTGPQVGQVQGRASSLRFGRFTEMGMNPRLTSGHTAFRRSDATLGEDRAAHRRSTAGRNRQIPRW
jgi:hypothetical protein